MWPAVREWLLLVALPGFLAMMQLLIAAWLRRLDRKLKEIDQHVNGHVLVKPPPPPADPDVGRAEQLLTPEQLDQVEADKLRRRSPPATGGGS